MPVVVGFPGASARQDAWGRLLKITAGGAELSTAAKLSKRENLILTFELGGERVKISACVHAAYDDDDGQRVAELRWTDMVARRRLARVLVDVLSRA